MKLPPYARRIPSGTRDVWVATGRDSWGRAKRSPHYMVALPPGEHAAGFCWPVCGADVVVVRGDEIDDDALLELAWALLRDGALLVATTSASGEIACFRPEVLDDAAR